MIHVQIRPNYRNQVQAASLQHAADSVLQELKKSGDCSIIITGNREIQTLNAEFRNVESPTDVLSFPDGSIDPESGNTYLGDIIISLMMAKKQAKSEGHTLDIEVNLLVVHGMLHLLGYDHMNQKERKIMWEAQGQILTNLGVDMAFLKHLE